MEPKLKVCIVCPSLQLGGLENAVTVLANYLASVGNDVTIVTIYRFKHFYTLDSSIKVIDPDYSKTQYSKGVYYLKTIKHIRSSVVLLKPDLVISYGDYHNALVLLATRGLRTKVFISDRASPDKKFPLFVSFLRKRLYKYAYGIIAQTNRAKEAQRKVAGVSANIIVIPNPVRPMPDCKRKKAKSILCAGRHYHVKGLDRAIRMFAQVSAADWTLKIAGSTGPETPRLTELIKELKLDDRVEFLGSVKEIECEYAQASIFVLPSRSEGYPNALIEAMASGLPSVAFDISAGPSDIIEDGVNGYLVDDGDIAAMARKVEYLIHNPEERDKIGRRASELRTRLSTDEVGKLYLRFFLS